MENEMTATTKNDHQTTAYYEDNETFGQRSFLYTVHCRYHDFPLHFHREEEIYFVRKGSAHIYINGDTFHAEKGDIVAVMPGQIHGYRKEPGTVLAFVRIDVNMQNACLDLSRIRLAAPHVTPQNKHYNELKTLFENIFKEDLQKQIGYLYMIRSYTDQLAALLLRAVPYHELTEEEADKHNKNMHMLHTVDRYLSKHYREKISLQQVADQCAMSKCYFSRCFHALTGQCFVHYLNDYRTKKAQELMINSDKSITEIAYESGFSNPRALQRNFIERFGLPPANYRKHLLQLKP